MSKVAAQPLADRVKASFLTQARDEGSPLTEEMLSERFGVSRGTIREVLVTLETQGLIERRRRTGTRLRTPDINELINLWDMRCALEGMTARLAAGRITEDDCDQLLDRTARRMAAAQSGDRHAVDLADIEFHQHIIDLSGNAVIRDVFSTTHLYDRLFHIQYSVPSYWPEDEAEDHSHAAIVTALRSHDGQLATDTVTRHIQAAKKRRIEALIGKIDPYETA